MKNDLTLRQYSYSIPVSLPAPTARNKKIYSAADKRLSLIKVTIDFENGNLFIDGDWQTLLAANKYNKASRFNCYKKRVHIHAVLEPALSLDLHMKANEGLAITLDGNIEDEGQSSDCTGLLVLMTKGKALQWTATMYIYDMDFPDWEILLTIPLYVNYPDACDGN